MPKTIKSCFFRLKEKMEEVSKEIESKYQLFDSELKKKGT